MGKKKSLSDVQRAQIIALHGQILSELQISPQMRNSRAAMHQAIAKYQQDGSYTDKKKTGRPRIATAREDHIMKRIVIRSPTSSMKKIKTDLLRRSCPISLMFVFKHLSKEFNLKSHKPAKNFFIELVRDFITILLIMWSSGLFLVGIGAILLTLCNRLVHCCYTIPHLRRYLLFR